MLDKLMGATIAPKLLEQSIAGQLLKSSGGLGGLMGLLGMGEQAQEQQAPQSALPSIMGDQNALPPLMGAQNAMPAAGMQSPMQSPMQPQAQAQAPQSALQTAMQPKMSIDDYRKYQSAMGAIDAINKGDFNALVQSLIMNS